VPLPAGLTFRAPEPRDADDVARLANAETFAALGLADTTPDELLSAWSEPHEVDGPRDAVVVDGSDTVVAFIAVRPDAVEHEVFSFAVLPQKAAGEFADALLAEIEERAGWWHRLASVEAGTLRVGALDAPGAWSSALERAGYRLARRFLLMRRSLSVVTETPDWPAGVDLRPFRREADARAVHSALAEAFADHFGPPFEPFETWLHQVFDQPALPFRDDLVLVAWADDAVAGALIAAESAAENPDGGYVAELGVRRAYRGQGLGRALLLEAFARMRALGRTEALLHVDADSETNATGLYRNAGMQEQRMYASWARPARS
jgi:ribosomal protein S18 acetylase RimI-like enzyme